MSYSLSVPATDRNEVAGVAAGIVADYLVGHDAPVHVCDHLEAVVEAIGNLVQVLGHEDDPIRITISGHANEGHAPSESWADEALTISLSVTAKT